MKDRRSRSRELLSAACLCCLLTGCAASSSGGPAERTAELGWTFDHGAVVRADPSRKELALIFTGGEYGEGTQHILDVLHRFSIRAAFFLTGDFIARTELRPLIRRMIDEGHYVGPHSDSHPLYCAWEDREHTLIEEAFFKADLRKNIADLRRLGALPGDEPVYFIPPYEWFNRDQVRWAEEMGIVLFNFSPGSGSNRDWIPEGQPGFLSSAEILADILAYEERDPNGLNGFLLLLHTGSARQDKMHLQLAPLLSELLARGYRLVRLDGLLVR